MTRHENSHTVIMLREEKHKTDSETGCVEKHVTLYPTFLSADHLSDRNLEILRHAVAVQSV